MTTPAAIPFPASQARRFDSLGGRAGSRLPDTAALRWVELPPGWVADRDCADPTCVPWRIRDQHRRTRATVARLTGATRAATEVTWHGPDAHARDVAECGTVLILDDWATPAAMLSHVAERVTTLTRVIHNTEDAIARWQDEQPTYAARQRDDLADCVRKRDAYLELFDTLVQTVTAEAV